MSTAHRSQAAAIAPRRPGGRLRDVLAMALYQWLYLLGLCVYLPVLGWRSLFDPRYRRGFGQRMGLVSVRTDGRPVVWIHGVSVGEIKAAANIIARLRRERPDLQIVLSSTTPNGHQVARQEHPDLQVFFYPLDFLHWPGRALDRIRPVCVLLMELEIWPRFLQAAARRSIPVAVINGRISERTFLGYRRARGLLPQLDRIRLFCVQDRAYERRLLDLGVAPASVVVTGNLKYDSVVMGGFEREGARLRAWLAMRGEAVVVAGSTHADEEEQLAAELASEIAARSLRLVVVPRHPERAATVVEALRAQGLMTARWTETDDGKSPLAAGAVLVVDAIGLLQKFYAACDVAFVGGSLIPRGGQNMLEPAAQGRAVLFGPHTDNFKTDVALLLDQRAAIQVPDAADLGRSIRALLEDEEARRRLGQQARAVIAANQGATGRTLDLMRPILPAAASLS